VLHPRNHKALKQLQPPPQPRTLPLHNHPNNNKKTYLKKTANKTL
jgi:hypothetical protein